MKIKSNSGFKLFLNNSYIYDILSGYLYRSHSEKKLATELPYSKLVSNSSYAYSSNVPLLQISLTDKCNMGCKYCSFRSREGLNNKPVNMSDEIAEKAISFFKEIYKDYQGYARIDFGLAGEPLLMRKRHPHLIDKAEEVLHDTKLKNIWIGTVTTNGTLALREEIADAIAPPMDISCDGPEYVHDDLRIYVNGKGTYKDVETIAKKVLQKHPSIGVSCVLTAKHSNFVEIFLHLREVMGFRNIYMKPVNLDRTIEWGLNEKTLEQFKEGYTKLIDFIMAQQPEKILDYLSSLSPDDYFMRFFYRVKDRSYQIYRCGAAKSGAYVDTDGKLYSCAHFIGKQGWDIGDIYNGFKEEEIANYQKLTVDAREPCKSCWARYLCGGGCYYQAALVNKDISKPDEVKCALILHLCLESIKLLIFLYENYPDVLSALPSPYFLSRDYSQSNANQLYEPSASLEASLSEINSQKFLDIKKTENILSPKENIDLEISQLNGSLTIKLDWQAGFPLENIHIFLMNPLIDKITLSDLALGNTDLYGIKLSIINNKIFKVLSSEERKIRRIPYIAPIYNELKDSLVVNSENKILLEFSLSSIWGNNLPDKYGFNLLLTLKNNGLLKLIRYEPYAMININQQGNLCPKNGEFIISKEEKDIYNNDQIIDFIPLGRWHGRMANIC